jgi:hypothetical protein
MAKKEDSCGMKSAVELALERMRKTEGDLVPLTHEQKAAIAEVEAETKAKVAEEEILSRDRIAAARASGDPEALRKVEEETAGEIARLRERGETKKRKIRHG